MNTSMRARVVMAIADRDGGLFCKYCGRELISGVGKGSSADPSIACVDHVMPASRGGSDDLDNFVLCCRKCNAIKKDKTASEYEDMLRLKELDATDPIVPIRKSELEAVIFEAIQLAITEARKPRSGEKSYADYDIMFERIRSEVRGMLRDILEERYE